MCADFSTTIESFCFRFKTLLYLHFSDLSQILVAGVPRKALLSILCSPANSYVNVTIHLVCIFVTAATTTSKRYTPLAP